MNFGEALLAQLLLREVDGPRAYGLGLQRFVHPLVAAVLLGFPGTIRSGTVPSFTHDIQWRKPTRAWRVERRAAVPTQHVQERLLAKHTLQLRPTASMDGMLLNQHIPEWLERNFKNGEREIESARPGSLNLLDPI